MTGRRVAALAAAVFLASSCLPLSQAGARSIHASSVKAPIRVTLGCSVGNPPRSYAAHCGLTLGMTVHLKAVTNHALGGGYLLWITGRRVTPPPALAAARTVCTRSPCLTDRFVRCRKSVTSIVAYDYQAWLVYHPSGTPNFIKKSNVVRVAWAPGSTSPTGPCGSTRTATLTLVPSLTKITNPNAPELTIDAAGGIAVWDHPRDGGQWKVRYTFKVPQRITAGKKAKVTVGMQVSNVNPEQPILFQMGVRAPDFAQAFSIHYPNPASGSKTFKIPISASYSAKELTIIISFVSAEVTYVYRRT